MPQAMSLSYATGLRHSDSSSSFGSTKPLAVQPPRGLCSGRVDTSCTSIGRGILRCIAYNHNLHSPPDARTWIHAGTICNTICCSRGSNCQGYARARSIADIRLHVFGIWKQRDATQRACDVPPGLPCKLLKAITAGSMPTQKRPPSCAIRFHFNADGAFAPWEHFLWECLAEDLYFLLQLCETFLDIDADIAGGCPLRGRCLMRLKQVWPQFPDNINPQVNHMLRM